MAEQKKKRFIKNLKNRYRLVIMNDETLEEKASFNLRPLNVFVATGLSIIFLITITTFLIAFTGLREYIPGYADLTTQWRVYNLLLKTDSMEQKLRTRDIFMGNLKNIINGKVGEMPAAVAGEKGNKYDTIHKLYKSPQDAELRKMIETQDQFSLAEGSMQNSMNSFLFFPPVKGTVTNRFDPVKKHYGIDIVANVNEPIKATLDGTVVISNFTSETGYVIGIQHSNNLFSFYKHNSALLKKAGDFVKAGEVVAIIGNSGELSEGPHLHFELWFNGSAMNPQQIISF
jgi:murein DD-endopeptidase MepM/ murein hydrolase activator NlpD